MTPFMKFTIDEVTLAARRIHGRYVTRSSYQAALAAELRSQGVPVRTNVDCTEIYCDVEVRHSVDMIVRDHLGIEVRTADNVLPIQNSVSLLQWYMTKTGLSHGITLDFAGTDLVVAAVDSQVARTTTG
jgi:GxxExxY protein